MKSAATISKNWFNNFRFNRITPRFASRFTKTIKFAGIDYLFLMTVFALVIFGLIMVYSSSFIFAQERTGDGLAFIKKQLIFSVLGLGAFFVGLTVHFNFLKKWTYFILLFATLLLALVWVPGIGTKVGGAQRWLRLGLLNFQPGEFAKFAVILFCAFQLNKKEERLHLFVPGVVSPILLALPALGLLLLQPDFGTTVLIAAVVLCLYFIAGVPIRYLLGTVLLTGVSAFALVWGSPYRRERLMTYFDPWQDPGGSGFQILQSFLGLHNGHWLGVGLGNGKEKLFFLPEAHNDFIFAVIGEELGFIGISFVVVAYVFLTYRGLKMSRMAQIQQKDSFAMLLTAGLTLILGLQAFVNMAVVLGLLPTKGLPLPFISYGGSALMINLFIAGLILNIGQTLRSKT